MTKVKIQGINDYPMDGNLLRQAIINGNFDIWQRGTSLTPSAATYTYTADRWSAYRNSANYTISRQAASLAGSQYCARIQRNNANAVTDNLYFEQNIPTEDATKFAGKTVTFSFYARAGANFSAASAALTFLAQYGTGTDQKLTIGFTGAATIVTGTATLTTTWQKFTFTGSLPSTATEFGLRVSYLPVGTAGAADYFEIAQVQVNEGDAALPFAPKSYGDEFRACQRFYFRMTNDSGSYSRPSYGQCTAATTADVMIILPVTMRIVPSFAYSGSFGLYTAAGGVLAVSSLTISVAGSSKNLVFVSAVCASGLTAGNVTQLFYNADANAYVEFIAEL